MLTRKRLIEILNVFPRCKVGVLGDVMLDEYLWGKVDRISPEAPVPIVQIRKETWRPGGAANVAANLVALGAETYIFGVIGYDGNGRKLREKLDEDKIHTDGLIFDEARRTTVKTRIIGHNQQMIRIDREVTDDIMADVRNKLTKVLDNIMPQIQGLIVSDYAKGTVTRELLVPLIQKFKQAGKFVNIDPKLKNFPLYEGATVITPNTKEAESALGRVFQSEEDVLQGGADLLAQLKTDAVLITRGEHGMSLFERGKDAVTIPTRALDVFDVTGAGDTVIATFSLAMAAGCAMSEAAELANLAAGVVVGIVGTATASRQQIIDHFDRIHLPPSGAQ